MAKTAFSGTGQSTFLRGSFLSSPISRKASRVYHMIPRLGKLGASSFGSCTIQNWQHPTLTKGILLCNAAVNNDPRHQDVLLHFGIATWQKKSNKKGPPNVP